MKVEGLTELKRVMKNMTHIENDVADIMKFNSSEAVDITVANAKGVMNKGYWTGNLARMVTSDMADKLSFNLISGAHYSGYLEYGTRFMVAEPFMRPSIKQIKKNLRDDFSRLLGN